MSDESKNKKIHLILSGNLEEGRSDAVYSQDTDNLITTDLLKYVKVLTQQVNTLTKAYHELQETTKKLEAQVKYVKLP